MSAAHHKLDNLIAIIDVNNQQADGPRSKMMGFEPLVDKLEGVRLVRAQGRRQRPRCRRRGFRRGQVQTQSRRPRMIVADTLMGKGVPFLEQREKNHFIRVEPHEWQLALAELEAGGSHEVGKLHATPESRG